MAEYRLGSKSNGMRHRWRQSSGSVDLDHAALEGRWSDFRDWNSFLDAIWQCGQRRNQQPQPGLFPLGHVAPAGPWPGTAPALTVAHVLKAGPCFSPLPEP